MKPRNLIILVSLMMLLGISVQAQFFKTVVSITGNVLDATTHRPIQVQLILLDENNKRINSTKSTPSENGNYFIQGLKPGKKYFISINQPEYFKEKYEVDVPNTDKYIEISKDFLVKPLKKESSVSIFPPFELNKSKIRVGAQDILNDWVIALNNNSNIKIKIKCYPDNNNDIIANQKLTRERAEAVKSYLTANGIADSFILIEGSEYTDPNIPPPTTKRAKGKRYIGTTYFVVMDF